MTEKERLIKKVGVGGMWMEQLLKDAKKVKLWRMLKDVLRLADADVDLSNPKKTNVFAWWRLLFPPFFSWLLSPKWALAKEGCFRQITHPKRPRNEQSEFCITS
jgi:hypothetical protein